MSHLFNNLIKVLGATTASLFRLLSQEFLSLVLLAFLLAAPLAWMALTAWLRNFPYHTDIGMLVFIVSGCSVPIIALLTIGIQTLRAAMASPVKAIRTND